MVGLENPAQQKRGMPLAKKISKWRKFRVSGIVDQGTVLPNTHHIKQSDSRLFVLEALGFEPCIQLKVPAH